jgi:hypothetical protein
VSNVAEMKDTGRWSFRHSWRVLNVTLPPSVQPITVQRAFLAALPCILSTMSSGNSASSSKLKSTGDGPWVSAPLGEVDPGPLPECAIRDGLGGAVVGVMIGFLLASFFPLESFALVAEASSLVTCLVAAALKHPRSGFLPDNLRERFRNARKKGGMLCEYLIERGFARCLDRSSGSFYRDALVNKCRR